MDKIKFNFNHSEMQGVKMMVQEWLFDYENSNDYEHILSAILLQRLFKKLAEKLVMRKAKYSFSLPMEQALVLLIHQRNTAYESVFMQNLQVTLINNIAPKVESIII